MRLASVRIDGDEVAAVVWAGGALPVAELAGPDGWPTDLFSLLEGGRLEDLRRTWDGLTERELEGLAGRAVPVEDLSYAPLYRRPRKIWGIGLNYAEHAGVLDERARQGNRRASCARTRQSSIPARRSGSPNSRNG